MQFVYDASQPYFNILVPTSDTVRFSFMLENLIRNNFKAFLTGGSGVGKSVIIKNLLAKMQYTDEIDPVLLLFSAQSSSILT